MSMSWSFHGANNSTLTSLDGSDPTLIPLLEDPNLTNALRIPTVELLDFVTRPDILNGLFDWVLTDQFQDLPNSLRNTRQALSILTPSAKPLQKRIFTQEITITRLNSFSETPFVSSPQICGHFQRVVEAFAQSNQGKGTSQLTPVLDYLTSQLSCLALRDLFVTLVTTENFCVETTPAFFLSLVNGLSGPNSYFLITGLFAVVHRGRLDIIGNLASPEIIGKLLDACILGDGYDPLVAGHCFQILERVAAAQPNISDLIASRADQFHLLERPIDCAFAFCARVFPADLPLLVSRVFDNPGNTFLNAAIVEAFKNLTPEALEVAAVTHELPGRIIAAFEANRYNGHITKIAELLKAIDPEPEFLQNDQWHEFVQDSLNSRITTRDQKFVESPQASDSSEGPPPLDEAHLSSDSDNDSDDYSDDNEDGIVSPPPRPNISDSDGEDGDSAPSDEDDDEEFFHHMGDGGGHTDPRTPFTIHPTLGPTIEGDDNAPLLDDDFGPPFIPPGTRGFFERDDDDDEGLRTPRSGRRTLDDDEEDEDPADQPTEEPPIPQVEVPVPEDDEHQNPEEPPVALIEGTPV